MEIVGDVQITRGAGQVCFLKCRISRRHRWPTNYQPWPFWTSWANNHDLESHPWFHSSSLIWLIHSVLFRTTSWLQSFWTLKILKPSKPFVTVALIMVILIVYLYCTYYIHIGLKGNSCWTPLRSSVLQQVIDLWEMSFKKVYFPTLNLMCGSLL